MILAHLADLHLGFRGGERTTEGRNVREADVAGAFLRTVDELCSLGPDLVVVAGDVFDRPDPPSAALVTLARGLRTLREALPDTPVLLVAGARDTPRGVSDPGVLAALDTVPGVFAASLEPRSVLLGEGRVHVRLLPHRAALGEGSPEPDPGARWNVLVTHALAAPAHAREGGRGPTVDPAAWDYVALGGEHVQRAGLPHLRWAGSLERVGWRPWEEALEEKGFLTYDLETGRAEFHPVPGRAVVSLAAVRTAEGDPDRLRRRVREVTDEVPGGIDGKIVYVPVQGAVPADLGGLQELLPALRDRALHLSVALADPPGLRPPAGDLRPRLAQLLEAEGIASAEAPARAAALLGEPWGVSSIP